MGELREKALHQEILQDMLPDFEVCARRAVEGVLGLPTFAPRGFRLATSRIGMSVPCCSIQCWNSEYTLNVSMGLHRPDLAGMVPGVGGSEVAIDAFGEVVNVLAGRLIGIRRLVEGFGNLAMSPPRFSDGSQWAPGNDCLHGMLVAKSTRLYFGLALSANGKDAE